MTFVNPLALLWLLAVPAVVALHLFRRRLVERRVAGLFLFVGDRLVASSGRKRTTLRNTPSLWLECLAAVAIALWLAGPSFGGVPARHLVIVLDDSASMAAGGAGRAANAARERAAALRSSDRATVLRTGPRPEVLVGPAAAPSDLDAALARWRPARPRHDPTPTIELARELAGAGGEVVFFTDEAPPPRCTDVDVVAFGRAEPNAAILTAGRVPSDAGEQLVVRLGATGAMPPVTLVVEAEGREIARENVTFVDGFADAKIALPPGAGALHLQLSADALGLDGDAWLLPVPERRAAVADLLPADLRERLQMPRVFDALRGFRAVTDPRDAQLVIATQPGLLRAGQLEIVFATPADGEQRDAWRGPFVIDRAHALLGGVQLHGVAWVAPRRPLPGRVLVAVGPQPLVTEEALDQGRRLWIAIDPAAGNVARSPDWPVLWNNLVEAARRDAPGLEDGNVLLGGEARWRRSLVSGGGDAVVTFVAPDGTRTTGKGVRTVGFVAEQPGVHRVLGEHDRELGAFAARFADPAESDLRSLVTGEWPRDANATASGAAPVRDLDVERRVLAFLLLVLLLCDWWWLAKGDK